MNLAVDKQRIAAFCRAHAIVRLAFFGSVLGDEFGPESDVDILVEFEPGTTIGFLGMARLEEELSQLLDRKVDLRTSQELSRYFRDDVLARSEVAYAA